VCRNMSTTPIPTLQAMNEIRLILKNVVGADQQKTDNHRAAVLLGLVLELTSGMDAMRGLLFTTNVLVALLDDGTVLEPTRRAFWDLHQQRRVTTELAPCRPPPEKLPADPPSNGSCMLENGRQTSDPASTTQMLPRQAAPQQPDHSMQDIKAPTVTSSSRRYWERINNIEFQSRPDSRADNVSISHSPLSKRKELNNSALSRERGDRKEMTRNAVLWAESRVNNNLALRRESRQEGRQLGNRANCCGSSRSQSRRHFEAEPTLALGTRREGREPTRHLARSRANTCPWHSGENLALGREGREPTRHLASEKS
jgi:hypothetical protein